MSSLVTYEVAEGIAALTMDDGKVNALSIPMLQELHGCFDRAEADAAVPARPRTRSELQRDRDVATAARECEAARI